MVKLTDMEKVIHAYISLHGDKDVTSIGTHNGQKLSMYSLYTTVMMTVMARIRIQAKMRSIF